MNTESHTSALRQQGIKDALVTGESWASESETAMSLNITHLCAKPSIKCYRNGRHPAVSATAINCVSLTKFLIYIMKQLYLPHRKVVKIKHDLA